MSRRALRLAALVSLGVLVPVVAIAYDWQGGKWARNEMPVGFQVSNDLSEDVPDRECLAAVQDGYNVWTALPCSYMRWEFTGRTPNTAWGVDDGVNISSWRESGWDQPSVVLGILDRSPNDPKLHSRSFTVKLLSTQGESQAPLFRAEVR